MKNWPCFLLNFAQNSNLRISRPSNYPIYHKLRIFGRGDCLSIKRQKNHLKSEIGYNRRQISNFSKSPRPYRPY